MNNAENFGSLSIAASIADFFIAVIRQGSIVVVVAMRALWPFIQPSPKNWPASNSPTTASLPCSDKDHDFDSALLKIVNSIRYFSLGEDDLALPIF